MAWDKGFKDVLLETDSRVALLMINNKKRDDSYNVILVDKCRQILQREWIVQIEHIYREANMVADWLANRA